MVQRFHPRVEREPGRRIDKEGVCVLLYVPGSDLVQEGVGVVDAAWIEWC